MIDKEILLIARNFDNLEVTLERKFLFSSKKVYIQKEILLISNRNQLKFLIRNKCVSFGKKCMNFAQNFLATPKLSWN